MEVGGGGPDWWMLCCLQTMVSMVALGIDVQEQGGGRECLWLGGFDASGLGWELVTKAKGEMVERRHLLDGDEFGVCGF